MFSFPFFFSKYFPSSNLFFLFVLCFLLFPWPTIFLLCSSVPSKAKIFHKIKSRGEKADFTQCTWPSLSPHFLKSRRRALSSISQVLFEDGCFWFQSAPFHFKPPQIQICDLFFQIVASEDRLGGKRLPWPSPTQYGCVGSIKFHCNASPSSFKSCKNISNFALKHQDKGALNTDVVFSKWRPLLQVQQDELHGLHDQQHRTFNYSMMVISLPVGHYKGCLPIVQ